MTLVLWHVAYIESVVTIPGFRILNDDVSSVLVEACHTTSSIKYFVVGMPA